MIKEVWGDAVKMLKSKEIRVLAHGCNCFNTMGSGIAAEIAKFFPDAVISDKMTKYGDINKLGNIDIVYIPTINSQHYENCKKALKHHKHVIVEKTFALTVLEAKELFTLAKKIIVF